MKLLIQKLDMWEKIEEEWRTLNMKLSQSSITKRQKQASQVRVHSIGLFTTNCLVTVFENVHFNVFC